MPRENIATTTIARLARIPFWASSARRPIRPPQKALILKTCCLSQVMLATPMLAALARQFPQAQFDWAVSQWARPAVASNPRISELIHAGDASLRQASWVEIRELVSLIRHQGYDTCFIPSRSSLLSFIAWQAGIPQRVGLNLNGRGFAHTVAVRRPAGIVHESALYLALAEAVGVSPEIIDEAGMEFYPPDRDRLSVTERLVTELDWLGDRPLVLLHPGGGINPLRQDPGKQWPVARFVLLANHLARKHNAQIILVGNQSDLPRAAEIAGLTSSPPANWAGKISLGGLGALSELADLYVGSDSGPTHIAAAAGCPTLAIFGPSDPAVSGPFATKGAVAALHTSQPAGPLFDWQRGATAAEAAEAADRLLGAKVDAELRP